MEGVSPEVHEKMAAVGANVLAEDGLMLRTCKHGIRHPVGHISNPRYDVTSVDALKRHERRANSPGLLPPRAECDGCFCIGKVEAA